MAAEVCIVDSGGANIASLQHALRRLGASSELSCDPKVLRAAPRLLLPGVGAAAQAMRRLRRTGLEQTLRELRQPLLGICLGMQLLFEHSEEGDSECLGLMPGRAQRLQPGGELSVPHMGWNNVNWRGDDPLLAGLSSGEYFYFVHSYAVAPGPDTLAETDYGPAFSAIVRRGNVYGVQFHPERSAHSGARLLRNFLAL